MKEIIKLESVNLIYQTAESLSVKKALKAVFHLRKTEFLIRYHALKQVSFSIEKGKVYGIVGSNGAGKSTLLRVLAGVMSPNNGRVERNYKSLNLLALGVGFSKDISGYDNVFLNGMLLGFNKKEIACKLEEIAAYSELGEFLYRPMKTYSSGMVSRLAFSIALHLRPEVLLIDEVLSVGDGRFREKSFRSIREMILDTETTVVLVSHSMAQVRELCDQAIWLEKGQVMTSGACSEVLELYEQFNRNQLTKEGQA